MLGVEAQTRVSGENRTHNPHANSLAHYLLGYQGTLSQILLAIYRLKFEPQVIFNLGILISFDSVSKFNILSPLKVMHRFTLK